MHSGPISSLTVQFQANYHFEKIHVRKFLRQNIIFGGGILMDLL